MAVHLARELRSLLAAARGERPTCRHDGAEWIASDTSRADARSLPEMQWRGVVIDFCGDWAEIALRYGFPTWSHLLTPCPKCTCNRREITNDSLDADFDFDG
eukprot:1455817-Pyramimonas_sp.AAC.1